MGLGWKKYSRKEHDTAKGAVILARTGEPLACAKLLIDVLITVPPFGVPGALAAAS